MVNYSLRDKSEIRNRAQIWTISARPIWTISGLIEIGIKPLLKL
jgi:hypothetical protein